MYRVKLEVIRAFLCRNTNYIILDGNLMRYDFSALVRRSSEIREIYLMRKLYNIRPLTSCTVSGQLLLINCI
jgi:hypothetical protein